jgi:hypothetical protein
MIRLALAATLLACGLGALAANVAFVADVRGNATIEGDGKLNFLTELAPGTRVLLGTGATAAITFVASGTEYTVTGPGEFSVTAGEVTADKGRPPVKRAVLALPNPGVVTRLSEAATASVRMRGISPPAPTPAAVLEYPVDARVATLKPVLRWKGDMSTEGVTVRVQDGSGKEVWKARVQPNSAAPPLKLVPATRYTWTLTTHKGAVAEAQFETMPADMVAKVEKSQAGARTFADRVLHAALLQDLGATHDAREAWAGLARERPDLPELAALAK